jgi:hypothetical protein
MWYPGLNNSPAVSHACRKRRLKWVPSTFGYNWVTLSPGIITCPPVWGLGAGLTIQPRKKVIVKKPQRGGQGPNWAVEPYDDDIFQSVEKQLQLN